MDQACVCTCRVMSYDLWQEVLSQEAVAVHSL